MAKIYLDLSKFDKSISLLEEAKKVGLNTIDETSFLSQYLSYRYQIDKSKRLGQKVLNKNPESLVIRTNFFGWGTSYRNSFSDWIIKSLRESKSIKLFSDVYFTPIYIKELVNIIHILLNKKKYGIYNIVSNERISKFNFGIKIAKIFGYPISLIRPISIDELNFLVSRPKDMSLSTKKISNDLNLQLKSIEDQLLDLKNEKKRLKI